MTTTDGYDPNDDHVFDDLDAKHARAMAARELYDRGIIGVLSEGGGGTRVSSVVYSGGGGGGGYNSRVFKVNTTDRLIPDLTQLSADGLRTVFNQPTPEERQEMNWTNPEARDIAREILSEKKREAMKAEVTEAVAHLQELIGGSKCGSVFTFRKTDEDTGKHYWYAAIKNGDRWYTTAKNPREIPDDEALIEWLVGLEAWKADSYELLAGPAQHEAIETAAVEL